MARIRSVEKRITSRVPIRVLVEYTSIDDFLADYTSNVSLGGMFIGTDQPLPIGTRFRLRFRLPERAKTVETFGEVRWVIPVGESTDAGMGIRFDELAPTDQKAIELFLEDWNP